LVTVNGNDFQATVAVNDKKKAKANAAMKCFQEMGFINPNPADPL